MFKAAQNKEKLKGLSSSIADLVLKLHLKICCQEEICCVYIKWSVSCCKLVKKNYS